MDVSSSISVKFNLMYILLHAYEDATCDTCIIRLRVMTTNRKSKKTNDYRYSIGDLTCIPHQTCFRLIDLSIIVCSFDSHSDTDKFIVCRSLYTRCMLRNSLLCDGYP
jgi:hypothetical protein